MIPANDNTPGALVDGCVVLEWEELFRLASELEVLVDEERYIEKWRWVKDGRIELDCEMRLRCEGYLIESGGPRGELEDLYECLSELVDEYEDETPSLTAIDGGVRP